MRALYEWAATPIAILALAMIPVVLIISNIHERNVVSRSYKKMLAKVCRDNLNVEFLSKVEKRMTFREIAERYAGLYVLLADSTNDDAFVLAIGGKNALKCGRNFYWDNEAIDMRYVYWRQ
jgi:ribonucleotide reductase beta subunit family protein with ferritin-like domain